MCERRDDLTRPRWNQRPVGVIIELCFYQTRESFRCFLFDESEIRVYTPRLRCKTQVTTPSHATVIYIRRLAARRSSRVRRLTMSPAVTSLSQRHILHPPSKQANPGGSPACNKNPRRPPNYPRYHALHTMFEQRRSGWQPINSQGMGKSYHCLQSDEDVQLVPPQLLVFELRVRRDHRIC